MSITKKKHERFTQSITVKAIIVAGLTLLLVIPTFMIQDLIYERQNRSEETIAKINDKWSHAQTLCAPILSIPYTTSYVNVHDKTIHELHTLHITPDDLTINAVLFPEERHYGIYKTILYKSEISMSGTFEKVDFQKLDHSAIHWDKAYIRLGLSDLRGVTNNIRFDLDGRSYMAEAGVSIDRFVGKELVVPVSELASLPIEEGKRFDCTIQLNGSSSMNFIPLGRTTKVKVEGAWNAPGYIGNFTPEHSLTESGFVADWSILQFNRSIPEVWIDSSVETFADSSFGVSLVDTVDHYQQNMRSAKYAIMFIGLTFIVFFFVEILTRRNIHPIQYLLVGVALVLFYTLLLSISEQLNFGLAYLIASVSVIGLITLYTKSVFKSWGQTGILTFTLCLLYTFLYVVLQLEDVALLIGSIGLFIILAIIMYYSRKVNWYKQDEQIEES